MMLHETAVAWVRKRMGHGTPAVPWEETVDQYKTRMQLVCRQMNAEYNVESLCKELPERLVDLKNKQGDKIKK